MRRSCRDSFGELEKEKEFLEINKIYRNFQKKTSKFKSRSSRRSVAYQNLANSILSRQAYLLPKMFAALLRTA
jgi:hypothetical protein